MKPDRTINVKIDGELHMRLKVQAAREESDFRTILERALEAELARCESPTPRPAG